MADTTPDSRLSTMLYRSLERLHLAIKGVARIGFEESSPTANEHHASIWNDLNDAQEDAELKLNHYKEAALASRSGPDRTTREAPK